MDLFNIKLSKPTRQLAIIALSLVAAAVTLYVVYAATARRNISLMSPEGQPIAANPSCLLNLTLYRPTPSPTPTATPNYQCNSTCTTGSTNQCPAGLTCSNGFCRNPSCLSKTNCICATSTPTPTPKVTLTPTPSSVCDVSFDWPDTAVCWPNPISGVPITYTIHSLPTSGGPYYMQTDWYYVVPNEGPHHYDDTQLIEAGQTYTVYADWPGLDGTNRTTEIHAGLNVTTSDKNILSPACSGGMDYYWTPYVTCPGGPTPPGGTILNSAPTPVPTPIPTPYCSWWSRRRGKC